MLWASNNQVSDGGGKRCRSLTRHVWDFLGSHALGAVPQRIAPPAPQVFPQPPRLRAELRSGAGITRERCKCCDSDDPRERKQKGEWSKSKVLVLGCGGARRGWVAEITLICLFLLCFYAYLKPGRVPCPRLNRWEVFVPARLKPQSSYPCLQTDPSQLNPLIYNKPPS